MQVTGGVWDPMEQAGPGPQTGLRNKIIVPRRCNPDAYPGPDLSRFAGESLVQMAKCSPSGFLCAPFLDKRGIIKFDHCNSLPSHNTPSCAATPIAPECLAVDVPIPALSRARGCSMAGGAHKPHRALGPAGCRKPWPCH